MKRNTQEKSLMQINENNIFYKIKYFFIKLFHKNTGVKNNINVVENTNTDAEIDNGKSTFKERIRNIENEETVLLKLQKRYRSGEIKEEDLSPEQINSLCILYDRQIAKLKKSNTIRKQRLLEYNRKLQMDD